MAVIGYLGKDTSDCVLFTVSDDFVLSPENMKWSGSARYATHQRHNTHALTEYTGMDPDGFTFDITLTAMLGIVPMDEIVKLWKYERDGEAVALTIGSKGYGKYRWNVVKHSTKITYTDGRGEVYAAVVSVTLQEYLRS